MEHTAQSLGSWWAGVRGNDENMDLEWLQWLLDGQINYVTVGPKKHLQLSEAVHGETVVMAVGRAVLGVRLVRERLTWLESEFNVNQAMCMDLTNMCDGGEAVSEFELGRNL